VFPEVVKMIRIIATNIPNCTPKYKWITEGISGCQFRSLEYIYIYIWGNLIFHQPELRPFGDDFP